MPLMVEKHILLIVLAQQGIGACAMKKPEKSAPHVVMTLSFRVVSKAHQVAVTQTNNPQAFMQALYIFGQ
jgi:hypothetical protein